MFLKMAVAAFAIAALPLAAAAQTVPTAFAPLSFLLGEWSGAGTSDAGAGSGSDTFRFDLQGNVVVRRSHAEYPGKDGKPGIVYDALMVVYADPAHDGLRADYFDNGHVIHYALVPGTDPLVARFVSDAPPGVPTFRLTYTGVRTGKTLSVKFEVKPPGATAYATIADGVENRVSVRP